MHAFEELLLAVKASHFKWLFLYLTKNKFNDHPIFISFIFFLVLIIIFFKIKESYRIRRHVPIYASNLKFNRMMHYASIGELVYVKAEIKAGVDIDEQDDLVHTPATTPTLVCHYPRDKNDHRRIEASGQVIVNNKQDIVAYFLFKTFVNLDIQNNAHKNALEIAESCKNIYAARLIKSKVTGMKLSTADQLLSSFSFIKLFGLSVVLFVSGIIVLTIINSSVDNDRSNLNQSSSLSKNNQFSQNLPSIYDGEKQFQISEVMKKCTSLHDEKFCEDKRASIVTCIQSRSNFGISNVTYCSMQTLY